jgi:hypothetical protein
MRKSLIERLALTLAAVLTLVLIPVIASADPGWGWCMGRCSSFYIECTDTQQVRCCCKVGTAWTCTCMHPNDCTAAGCDPQ